MKKYRTTTIEMKVFNSERAWLTPQDFNEWVQGVFNRDDYATLEQGKIPGGVAVRTSGTENGLGDIITVHLAMPRKKINRELQDALFSLERVVPISITVEEGALSLAEIEALEISIDPAYAEISEDADN
ncbi:hypothetical protein [uncultured Corynebacterium sp.]|uniref:hypothetical protein n=1 Tax=uncultured Corynebacterium sp. TaxID=159447 RepID=UPI0025CFAB84|nr:hypothetical protein [uncultured Corynebacterium sp.]